MILAGLALAGCVHLSHDDKVILIAATVDGAVAGAMDALVSRYAPHREDPPDAGPPPRDGGPPWLP